MRENYDEIYLSVLGEAIDPVPGVENAFAPGKPCAKTYGEIREAYLRLCQRLGVQEEDGDLETIVRGFFTITDELCRTMYFCGAKYGAR